VSRLRLVKIATPSAPAANKAELFYGSALAVPALLWEDENGTTRRIGGTEQTAGGTGGSAAAFAADTYIPGTSIVIPKAGSWTAGMRYHAVFDMVKTGAGTSAFVVTLRMGTAGSTSDAAILTFTSASAQTANADTGVFTVDAEFRSVGSGTSAVLAGILRLQHHLAATGLTQTGAAGFYAIPLASSGFDSTTPTTIGLSFNGGGSFSGTNVMSSAVLLG